MSGYQGPFTIGKQPCKDFNPTGIESKCSNCDDRVARCCKCGINHHFAGYDSCFHRVKEANVLVDQIVKP